MKNVYFDFPVRLNTGISPKISSATSRVVEVHQSHVATTLWYQVGTLNGNRIDFGDSHQYAEGAHPSVGLNSSGAVVEVHEKQSPFSPGVYYQVGQVDPSHRKIRFGDHHQYDEGRNPNIALNDANLVVEVHESDGLSTDLWYRVGRVDLESQTIDFGDRRQYDTGSTPSVAINNHGVVIIVHQSEGPSPTLSYQVGIVDPAGQTLDFGTSIPYDQGANPSIALTDDGLVIEVHRSESTATLWKRIGQVDPATKTIQWAEHSIQYASGVAPSVSADQENAVEIHQNGSLLLGSTSRIMDRANWMHDHLGLIGGQRLKDIVMPASHDAGMSESQDCKLASACNTRTQKLTVTQQLEAGSRYFDIRPVLYGGFLYTGHYDLKFGLGCNGPTLAQIFTDVDEYLQHGKDLVILKFSHYYDRDGGKNGFSETQMKRLIDQLTSALGPKLFYGTVPPGGLATVTVNEYIASGGVVLAVFDDLSPSLKSKYPGIYSYADQGGRGDLVVYDKFSDTNNLDKMISDQFGKLRNPANHRNNLFLLSWTLTQSPAQAVGCVTSVSPSIFDLAQEANAVLRPQILGAYHQGHITRTLIPNLLYVDHFQGPVTDLAVWLNQILS